MRRYWLFAGENYYPLGGVRDLVGDYDSPEDAERIITTLGCQQGWIKSVDRWAHVYDAELAVVCSSWSYWSESADWFKEPPRG